jgi:hypothetical protein
VHSLLLNARYRNLIAMTLGEGFPATVELGEGIRVIALVQGASAAKVRVGTRVRFQGLRAGGDSTPLFRVE